MSQRYSEAAFETVIEAHLLANGYVSVDRASFDRERAIFPETALAFIRVTQPKEWARLEALHGERTGEQILKSLVAFSGTVQDDELADVTYTETGMNHGIREKELPEKFATQEYQVLLVAEKYQTGFDQPLLHTMYVDKRLAASWGFPYRLLSATQSIGLLDEDKGGPLHNGRAGTHEGDIDIFDLAFPGTF